MYVYLYIYVCVCEREREREREFVLQGRYCISEVIAHKPYYVIINL